MSFYLPDQWVVSHIRMRELACKCDRDCEGKYLDDIGDARSMSFLRRIGELRHEFGLPIKVNSGFRCPVHNAEEGGSPDSAHIYKVALDLYPLEGMWYDLAHLAEMQGCYSGIIVYPAQGFVHLDQHPTADVRRGYSYGPRDEHVITWGQYDDHTMLDLNEEWNVDYVIPKPDYILKAEERMQP